MSSEGAAASEHGGGGGEGAAGDGDGTGVRHPRSFKLRFAAQREPGRSYISSVKPLGVPATVTGKFYSCRERECEAADAAEQRALRRLRGLVAPPARAGLTSAGEYGRWVGEARAPHPRLDYRLEDSAWLKARLAVLAADASLKPH